MQVPSLGWEDPLEEGLATHSHILAWRIPWTQEPGGLQRVRSDLVTEQQQPSYTCPFTSTSPYLQGSPITQERKLKVT